jgi:hypothetical protein
LIGPTRGIEKEVSVTGTINQYTLATPAGTDNNTYQAATGPTVPLLGVFQFAPNTDQPQVRVMLNGISWVKVSAGVNIGNPITSDTSGNGTGVAAAPAAGVNNYIIGFALASISGAGLVPVLIAPGRIQG